jgi:hypothetical protein
VASLFCDLSKSIILVKTVALSKMSQSDKSINSLTETLLIKNFGFSLINIWQIDYVFKFIPSCK